jgi:cellulose synthase operon protein C
MTTIGPPADGPLEPGAPPDRPVDGLGPDAPIQPRIGRVRTLTLGALMLLGVLLLIGLAPAAHHAAGHLPLAPADPTPIVAGATRPGTTAMRNLPVGLPAGVRVVTTHDVYPYAVAALGVPGAHALMAVLTSGNDLHPDITPDGKYVYPYHYAELQPILDAAPPDDLRRNATLLAAALIELAGQPASGHIAPVPGAAQAAYALLDRGRSSGGCDDQLDLLLLVAADPLTTLETLADEQVRTTTACPNEPTPGWVAGQAQMRKLGSASTPRPARVDGETSDALAADFATFQDLTQRFPGDTAAVTGLGDAYLRAGLRLLSSQPFTARRDLQLAVAQYNHAAELGDGHDADLGRARALTGLDEAKQAVPIAQQAVAGSTRPGSAREVLLAADQSAQDFSSAENVARDLDRIGPAAYPAATAFYPRPTDSDRRRAFDASLPLSMGADTLAPLYVHLAPQGGAGGTLEDLSLIPQYRDDLPVTATLTDCPSLAWRRDAILAGHAAQALQDWPQQFTGVRPDAAATSSCAASNLESIAALAVEHPGMISLLPMMNQADEDRLTDEWQNLLRWAGDLRDAATVTSDWEIADGDSSAEPALRFGEVAFLQRDYNEAAAQFDVAARRARVLSWNDDLTVEQALLNRGTALFKAARSAEAVALLRPVEQQATQGYAFQRSKRNDNGSGSFAAVAYFAAQQLADYESATGDLHAAVDDYQAAASWTPPMAWYGDGAPMVVFNNLALADLSAGATDTTATEEAQALRSDPMDPVFLMTAGFIADRAGKTADAANYDQRALASDPGEFPAANDLGVELAREHHDSAAEAALRQAIGAYPGYALGWFNLGVLEGQRGPLHLLASQGALAKAFTLDPTLKDRHHELTIDGKVYRTALDLSKPLPPRWSLADTQQAVALPATGLLTVLLLALGLARSSSRGGTELAKHWLKPIAAQLARIRGPKWVQRPYWGVAATAIAFVLTYLRHADSTTEMAGYALGVVILTGAAMYARLAIAARTKVATTQTSWLPGVAFGLTTGAIGFPWAPLPVVKTSVESPRIHLAAPLTVAALSLLLFVESAWLNVPLTQAFAVAALVMAGSTLLPIDPLDGANVGKAGVVAAVGVVAGAGLVALGVI